MSINISITKAPKFMKTILLRQYSVFIRSPRIGRMVESGGATAADFRDVFKNNIDKRIKNLPEIDGLSKETVLRY